LTRFRGGLSRSMMAVEPDRDHEDVRSAAAPLHGMVDAAA
jgi:hypothetical protein